MNTAYIPLLVAAVSIAGAALIYWFQKRADRKSALIELRRKSYRNYLKAFVAMTNTPEREDDITSAYGESEFELLVVGSDDVIRSVAALGKFYSDTNHDRYNRDVDTTKQLIANVCRAMRKDCFEKTNLSEEDVIALIPMS